MEMVHTVSCIRCSYTSKENCVGGTATCTEPAICEICGEAYGSVDVSHHVNIVKIAAKEATHLEPGNIEYWYCNDCGKYFSDEAGTQESDLADTVIPRLTEHIADNTGWHADGEYHWQQCLCREIINREAHSFEWVTDQKATETQAGFKHEECKICGYQKETVEIPPTGTTTGPNDDKNESPSTGDTRNYFLWLVLLLASGIGMVGIVIYKQKKKYNL